MKFKEWLKLQEVGTSTASVAVFARPVMGMATRMFPEPISFLRKKHRRKNKRN